METTQVNDNNNNDNENSNNNNSNNNNNSPAEDKYQVKFEKYQVQRESWPKHGRHILAQYNDSAVLVYQAYNQIIGRYAVQHQKFEGCPGYNHSRMTWIKTNFLWMMFRSAWGTKSNQQVILGIWLKREAFERILSQSKMSSNPKANKKPWQTKMAVQKTSNNEAPKSHEQRKADKTVGTVRLQWDPDHYPNGERHPYRRAIQLGLKGVQSFVDGSDIERIVDMSPFIAQQRPFVKKGKFDDLVMPKEEVYHITSSQLAMHIGLLTDNKKEQKNDEEDDDENDDEEASD